MWVICSWSSRSFAKKSYQHWKFLFFVCFWQFFPFFMPRANCFCCSPLICSFFIERLYRFASVALYKRATVNDLLRSLITKEWPWAIHSGCSWQKRDRSDSLIFTSKSLFCSKKTSESLEKPMSKFPTLPVPHPQNYRWWQNGKQYNRKMNSAHCTICVRVEGVPGLSRPGPPSLHSYIGWLRNFCFLVFHEIYSFVFRVFCETRNLTK